MKKYILLALILTLAAFLRLYKLGEVPGSLDWDEASLGWNSYSLLKTGTDEYGKAWPVSIRSFNDYKPPMYVYVSIPSIAIFGLNEFAVRLPSAIAGIIAVLFAYFLVKELTKDDKISLLTAALLAISPWHLQFSRAAFEANLALMFFVGAGLFLAKFLNTRLTRWFFISELFYIFSFYSYHSSRLVVPVFLLLVFVFNWKTFLQKWKYFIVYGIFFIVTMVPLVINTIHTGSLSARFTAVSILDNPKVKENNINLFGVLANNYLSHFNFDFLFLKADGNDRHHVPDMGLLYLIEFPILLVGIYYLIKNKPAWLKYISLWFFCAPIASSVGSEAPHAIRSLLLLPIFQLITAYGILNSKKLMYPIIFLLYILFFSFYIHQYYVHFPVEYARNWQYGYKEVVKEVVSTEKNYDKVFVTTYYDQPYIYFLFYGRISPVVKNTSFFFVNMDKYRFLVENNEQKGLYILAPVDDHAGLTKLKTVYFPNGQVAFDILEKK